MPELHACYFCGSPDELGSYQVVPPRLDPTDAEQRTVRLCPTCREKLMSVLQPLVDRTDAADSDESDAISDERDAAPDEDGEDDRTGADPDGDAEVEPVDDGETERASEAEAEPVDDGGTEPDDVAGDEPAGATPPGYGKVMRLLRNREFPVDRDDVEVVAMNAYDMRAAEVDAVIEAAVDRGELVADGDALDRP